MTDMKRRFADLHRAENPLLLYNIWDAGSAAAVAEAGAPAIATGSMALAGAQGFADGEAIPLNLLLTTIRQIVAAVDCPVTADFEGGYAGDPAHLADHAQQLVDTGVVGCNFEDRIVAGEGLYTIEAQAKRIAAVAESGLFVNARTDIFLARLMAGENPDDPALVPEALERAAAYAEGGAACFFVPGLADTDLIARICEGAPLPVNVMMREGVPDVQTLGQAGVARVSWGPGPWADAMAKLRDMAGALYA